MPGQLPAGTEQFLLLPCAQVGDVGNRGVDGKSVAAVEVQRTGAPSVKGRMNGQAGCRRIAQDVGNRFQEVLGAKSYLRSAQIRL